LPFGLVLVVNGVLDRAAGAGVALLGDDVLERVGPEVEVQVVGVVERLAQQAEDRAQRFHLLFLQGADSVSCFGWVLCIIY